MQTTIEGVNIYIIKLYYLGTQKFYNSVFNKYFYINSTLDLFVFYTQDPKILHPVAVRVTPGIDNCIEDQEKEILNNVEEMVLIKSIQRPQAKKLSRMYI